MLHLEVYTDRVKSLLLPSLWKYTAKILTKLRFLLIYSFFVKLMDENIAYGNNNQLKWSKTWIIRIQIIGRIFNVQNADSWGETDFVRIISHSIYRNSTVLREYRAVTCAIYLDHHLIKNNLLLTLEKLTWNELYFVLISEKAYPLNGSILTLFSQIQI